MAVSKDSSDYGTLFNDPRKVHQWAVTSANGSAPFISPELSGSVLANDGFNDLSLTGLDLDYQADIHSALHFSMLSHSGVHGEPVARAVTSDMFEFSTGIPMTRSSDTMYSSDVQFMDNTNSPESLFTEPWSVTDEQLGASMSVEMAYTTSTDSYQHVNSDHSGEPQLQSYWRPARLQGQDAMRCPSGYHSMDAEWSPPSSGTMDPSVSSSYSQPSFMHQHAGYLPYNPREDINSVAPLEDYGCTGVPTDGACPYPYSSSPLRTALDMSSTLRPTQVFQRTPLASAAFQPQYEYGAYPVISNTHVDSYMSRRSSGDGEKSTARCDSLYQVGPQEDGLYHCPFELKGECTHRAEKLKCNYDKHLDSHLKPYRCKIRSCGTVPFSSTACLLRHEREAHGMHGHGEKPYLCKYEDCDRSITGNGFPRRWNLQDHMKRVHDDLGPPSTGSASPSPSVSSTTPSKVTMSGRKKKASISAEDPPSKRPRSMTNTRSTSKSTKSQSAHRQGKQKHHVQRQWRDQHAAVRERLDSLNPTDVFGYKAIGTEYAILQDLGKNLHAFGADHYYPLD